MSNLKIFAKAWATSGLLILVLFYAYLFVTGTIGDIITNVLIERTLGMITFPFSIIIQFILDPWWASFQTLIFITILVIFWYTDDDYR